MPRLLENRMFEAEILKIFDITNTRYNELFSISPRGSLYREFTVYIETPR